MRNWAVRDYGNRIGIWPLMEVLTRYGIGANAALNTEVCDHHPEMIEEGGKLGWEWIGHNQTKALRLTEMVLAKLPKAETIVVASPGDRLARLAAPEIAPAAWMPVMVLAGGTDAWRRAGQPVVTNASHMASEANDVLLSARARPRGVGQPWRGNPHAGETRYRDRLRCRTRRQATAPRFPSLGSTPNPSTC